MASPFNLSPQEIKDRVKAKRRIILDFLASGEVWTTTEIACLLLQCARPGTLSTLKQLERDKEITAGIVDSGIRKISVYGITSHGLAVASQFGGRSFDGVASINPAYISHHTDTQLARLMAEAAGWLEWKPGKALYGAGFLKVPDALVTTSDGQIVSVEIERHVKTPKRYSKSIAATLQDIKAQRYQAVHYISPSGQADLIRGAFHNVKTIKVAGEYVEITERHRARFGFFNLSEWPTLPIASPSLDMQAGGASND
ncbi:MAG: hypothetical protein PHU46_15050 [Rhodocyclaceae bacterium]|nr:hypothetical protein [Rhodocyclaceae bacterium]